MGGNVWANSFASGTPVTGRAGDGEPRRAGRGPRNNVDLTGELVSMITAQRIYQANAQSIKTRTRRYRPWSTCVDALNNATSSQESAWTG